MQLKARCHTQIWSSGSISTAVFLSVACGVSYTFYPFKPQWLFYVPRIKLYIVPTQSICVFRMFFRAEVKWLFGYVTETGCVYCAVRTESWSIMQVIVMAQSVYFRFLTTEDRLQSQAS